MSDILQVLPGFQTAPYAHILPSLDKSRISTVDLISLPATEIAKRAQIPPVEVAKLADALVEALRVSNESRRTTKPFLDLSDEAQAEQQISTLDAGIDAALNGGIQVGSITEFTGERFAKFNTCYFTCSTNDGK
jgi:DNA repair protein RAD57